MEQNIVISTLNSSTGNIGAGATFTGFADSTAGVVGIQVSFYCDQNCTVYVEQSTDTTPIGPHWDISDSYSYYANTSFGITVQAISSYVRVRVTNSNTVTGTSIFRLHTLLCPIISTVPRSLDEFGNLQTSIWGITDRFGFSANNTPNNEIRSITPIRLAGANFEGTTIDPNYWTVTNTNGGTTTQANVQIILSTNTTANGATNVISYRRARYVSNVSMVFRTQLSMSAGVSNNVRNWGIGWGASLPTITDGAYFQLTGSTFNCVLLKGGTPTTITSGSFNGTLGTTYVLDTANHTYEIYWNNANVWFCVDNNILHTYSATSATWAATMSHYIYISNTNTNGITSNNTLTCRVAAIRRLGSLLAQPTYKYQSGITAGVICKYGPGNLHSLVLGSTTNNSVITLYDDTSSGGNVIWSGTMGNTNLVTSLDFKGLPFLNGLFLVIATQPSNVTLIYE